ncbi:MAG: ABC transporter ATP-binding protein [Clostridiaceae bacterium]|nr:ABC transporter ATP-binding protein [Clostridiaceae bacterium]
MTEQSAVQIEDLSVRFGRQVVLPKLNVTIPEGQIIGLLGPSGSGKTTLVKSIIGTNPFQAGSITVFGSRVPSFRAMSMIGYMAQNDALYDDLSAMDNLLFFGRLCGIQKRAAQSRANELLDFVGLDDVPQKPIHNFSGGMKRRVSLAISLMNHPRLLILDEPTVGVDPVLRRKFWRKFEALKADGCTILTTTHVMDEAARCDRILLLREGKLLANGAPCELLAQAGAQNIEDAFLRFSGAEEKEAN